MNLSVPSVNDKFIAINKYRPEDVAGFPPINNTVIEKKQCRSGEQISLMRISKFLANPIPLIKTTLTIRTSSIVKDQI